MATVKELREKGIGLAKEIEQRREKFNANGKKWTDDAERQNWDKVCKDYDDNHEALQIAQREEQSQSDVEKRFELIQSHRGASTNDRGIGLENQRSDGTEKENRTTQVTEEHRALAMQAWMVAGAGEDLDERQIQACKLTGIRPNSRKLELNLMPTTGYRKVQDIYRTSHPSQIERRLQDVNFEKRDLTIGNGPSGGFLTAPETMLRKLEVNMLKFGGVSQVAETIRTSAGERMSWPTADDTSNTGVQLGESTTIGSSVDPSFAKVYWDAYKFSSKPILVPFELLQDSAFDLASLIGEMLGERLGRIRNTKFTTGTGAATPKGIVVCSSLGVTAASQTAITADEIIDLEHSIDPAYRVGGGFMFHDGILKHIRKLKDGEGRYLWSSGISGGVPDTLLTYPYTINQDMQSSVATGTKTMIFGQLSKYKIREVGSVRFYRLQERYRDTDQDGFIAFIRCDGNMLTAGTAPIKHLIQA